MDFKWNSVAESLPKELKEVLMLDVNTSKKEIGYYVDNIKAFLSLKEVKGNFFNTTHWFYIPETIDF